MSVESAKRPSSSTAGPPAKRYKYEEITCPNHPDANLVEDYHAGDMICSECGLVVGDRIVDVGSEWRTFSNDRAGSDPSRVGEAQNPLMEGHDLSTVIGPMPGDNSLGSAQGRISALSGPNRALRSAFHDISQMAERLQLPRGFVDRCKALFKEVHNLKHLKGRSNEAIASACLFIACRQEGGPRTFKEICGVSDVSKKDIGRTFKLILRAIDMPVDPAVTDNFMARFCANLGLSLQVQRAATHIAQKTVELDLCPGRVYTSIIAAAIYMAAQATEQRKTQKEIGDVVGVADVTIRQAYRLMYPRRKDLFPQGFQFKTSPEDLPKL